MTKISNTSQQLSPLEIKKIIDNKLKALQTNNTSLLRKAVLSDFIKEDININNKSHQVDKIKTFRQQEEHGEKKFIKP